MSSDRDTLLVKPDEEVPLIQKDHTSIATQPESSIKKYTSLLIIMALINVLGPLSTEAQVPAFNEIAADLHTTAQWVQLTISIYMLFFGASQLFFGTWSDMYGRKKTLLCGLVIYILGSIGCALSPNIIALNVFRAIQASGSGAGMVIVNAIARDVFVQEERAKVIGIMNGLRTVIIGASPVYGGCVSAFLGWRFIFWIIGGLTIILLLIVAWLLIETRPEGTVRINRFSDYADTVKLLVRNQVFVGLVLISGAVYAGVFIMFNEFSFVMKSRYDYGELYIGLLCGYIVCGLAFGTIISMILNKYIHPVGVISIGTLLLILTGGLLVLPIILYGSTSSFTVYWTVIPLFLYVTSDGLMLPNLISLSLEPFQRQAGTASSLSGFWRFFSAAVIALVVSTASNGNHLYVLHIGTASMTVLCIIIYVFTLWRTDIYKHLLPDDTYEKVEDSNFEKSKEIDVNKKNELDIDKLVEETLSSERETSPMPEITKFPKSRTFEA